MNVLSAFPTRRPMRAWRALLANVLLLAMACLAPAPAFAGNPGQSLCASCSRGGTAIAPKIVLTSPAAGSTASAPATFALAANASSDGVIVEVTFYANGVPLASDTTYPYASTFTTAVPGSYGISAMVTDSAGLSAMSVTKTVYVTNAAPSVSLAAPANGATAAAPALFTLAANAADSDGSIVRVDFLSSGRVVCRDASPPYSCVYSGVPAGSYAISAVATDNIGAVATSATATVTVTGSAAAGVSETRKYYYDAYQRLCKTINPESYASIVEYDWAGNVWRTADSWISTDPGCVWDGWDGIPVYRAYDAMNRLVRTWVPWVPADQLDVSRTYYPDGAVQSITAAKPGNTPVTTTYEYNQRGLLTGETSINGSVQNALRYGYSADGFLASIGYPDGQVVGFTPDGLGRAQRVASASGTTYASAISYFPGGAISGFTYGNGIVHSMTQNARRLPTRSRDLKNAAAVIDDIYDFDVNGNVVDITDRAQGGLTTRGMGYDGLDRLTAVVSPGQWGTATYGYDALDNITRADVGSRQFRYNYNPTRWVLDSIKSPSGATLFSMQYDDRGNLTKKNNQTYAYDLGNRLNQVTGVQVYRYDGLGRRVQTTDADGKTTFWIYSQAGQVLFTSEARRSQNLSYIYLGNTQVATRSVAWGTGAVSVRYQHTDALGSPVAETSETGAVLKRNSYEPYGASWGTTSIDGTGYTGHVMDRETGLTYMQQRYYDPLGSRFLNIDPVAVDKSTAWNFNRYEYATSNPYKFKDPDGRIIDTIADVAFIAADVAEIASGGLTATNGLALAADVAGALIPGATGLGSGVRAASRSIAAFRGSKLARAMAKAGREVKKGAEQAHHIVAQTDKRAAEARAILERNGIGVHSAENGVAMAKSEHGTVHTSKYHEEVTGRLQAAETRGKDAAGRSAEVRCELACMGKELETTGRLNK